MSFAVRRRGRRREALVFLLPFLHLFFEGENGSFQSVFVSGVDARGQEETCEEGDDHSGRRRDGDPLRRAVDGFDLRKLLAEPGGLEEFFALRVGDQGDVNRGLELVVRFHLAHGSEGLQRRPERRVFLAAVGAYDKMLLHPGAIGIGKLPVEKLREARLCFTAREHPTCSSPSFGCPPGVSRTPSSCPGRRGSAFPT